MTQTAPNGSFRALNENLKRKSNLCSDIFMSLDKIQSMKALFAGVIFIALGLSNVSAQTSNHNSRLSIISNIGLINNSFLHNPISLGILCSNCEVTRIEMIPKPSFYWNFGFEFRLGEKHNVGLGFQANKIKSLERIPNDFNLMDTYYFNDVKLAFRGVFLHYRIEAIHGKNYQVAPLVGFQYDRPDDYGNKGWPYSSLRKNNFSVYIKTEVAMPLNDWVQLSVSPIFKMALRRYDVESKRTKFTPFGYGIVVGWRIKWF